MTTARTPNLPWLGYLAIDDKTKVVVGTCAFKAAPTPDGVVEIAYFTFPQFEGQGYATAMAEKLIAIGVESAEVRHIIAHTLPERNASARILAKVRYAAGRRSRGS
ncbi:GNAT family N-acetyltransferase [Leptolyngbya sp. FACHB-261]|nr:GNAT family N-acetyltransferase [Leptolyngbya sp. FACHB-261]